jgi:membrane-associated protease RseP (regulator of RpoE activity)
VLVRLERITGVDLNVFEFDYDLTFMVFFMGPDGKVLGRYGGRDASSPDKYLSLSGLRFAMQAALDQHQRSKPEKAPVPAPKKLLVEDYPAARRLGKKECIHCHQVFEFRRAEQQSLGRWRRDDIWVYPLPQNVGLTLDVNQGNRVQRVTPNSSADRAGMRAGDTLKALNGISIASFGDVQYALHRAPAVGKTSITWQRAGKEHDGTLELAASWRKTNPTWRPSLLEILPSIPLSGDDLTNAEKKALGIEANRLAFRQDKLVTASVRAAGIQQGDVVIGVDGRTPNMKMDEFFAHIRMNYLVGDSITLNLLREGKRVDVTMKLR